MKGIRKPNMRLVLKSDMLAFLRDKLNPNASAALAEVINSSASGSVETWGQTVIWSLNPANPDTKYVIVISHGANCPVYQKS